MLKLPTILGQGVVAANVRCVSASAKIVIKPIPITHEFHKVMKWVKPDYFFPWHPQRTCDLKPLPKVDPNWLKLEFRPFADIIEKLPANQRKLFTVAYGHRKDGINVIMEETLKLVRQHQYDNLSLDYRIAHATIKIRNYQDQFAKFRVVKKSAVHRNNCKELIDKRKKWLRMLRREDYKRFEWIIEVLSILYKPLPKNVRIERKASLTVMVNMLCNEIREQKMGDYKKMLESEKVPFLEMKLDTLLKIKADEDSINVECSVEEDIKETRDLLEKLTKSHLTVFPVDSQPQLEEAPKQIA